MSEKDISTKHGDKIFCVFDSDVNPNKQDKICKAFAKAKKRGIEIIMSVPSFELWYLLHYKKTARSFDTNKKLVDELKKYIPNYDKSDDIFPIVIGNTKKAVCNSKFLKKHHQLDVEKTIVEMKYNPSTDVYKVIEYINSI